MKLFALIATAEIAQALWIPTLPTLPGFNISPPPPPPPINIPQIPTPVIPNWSFITPANGLRPSVMTAPGMPAQTQTRQPMNLNAAGLRNFDKYNDMTRNMWNSGSYEKTEVTQVKGGNRVTKRYDGLGKRQNIFGNWAAFGYSFSTTSWGWYQNLFYTPCNASTGETVTQGHIMKTVFNQESTTELNPSRDFKFWWNETEKRVKSGSTGRGTCNLSSGWQQQQCVNKIWVPETASWVPATQMNILSGYTMNNQSYDGHMVRTIYDCLLDRVAVEYNSPIFMFGQGAIQYKNNGIKYYRFYDLNNFAWFVACPPQLNTNWKRSGLRGWNGNPVWDFSTMAQKDPRTDMTPYPYHLIPGYNPQTSYVAMYWPGVNNQTIQVGNDKCVQFAVSRPGLRHWTARLVDLPPIDYPSIEDEIKYPAGWEGFDKYSYSFEEPGVRHAWT